MDGVTDGDTDGVTVGNDDVSENSQQHGSTTRDEDPFMSCQVNISIVKTLTEESKLYKSTVNKEYLTCGPLSTIHKSNASTPEQASSKTGNEDQTSIVEDVIETSQPDETVSKPLLKSPPDHTNEDDGAFDQKYTSASAFSNEFCIIDAVSLKSPIHIKEEPIDEDYYSSSGFDYTKYYPSENENHTNHQSSSYQSFGKNYEQSDNCEFSITGVISLKEECVDDELDHVSNQDLSNSQFIGENDTIIENEIDIHDCELANDEPPPSDSILQVEFETCNGEVSIGETLSKKVFAATPSSFVLDQHYNASDRLRIKKMLADIQKLHIKPTATVQKETQDNGSCSKESENSENVVDPDKNSSNECSVYVNTDGSSKICMVCGRSFLRDWNFERHQAMCGKHICHLCNRSFAKKAYLAKHKKRGRCIASTDNFTANVKVENTDEAEVYFPEIGNGHVFGVETETGPSKSSKTEKESFKSQNNTKKEKLKYACKRCSRTYSKRENLIEHEKLHSLPKRFTCNRCGRAFSKNKALETHLLNHDLYVHQCQLCSQVFARARDVDKHKVLYHSVLSNDNRTSNVKMGQGNGKKLAPFTEIENEDDASEAIQGQYKPRKTEKKSSVGKKYNNTDSKEKQAFVCKHCNQTFSKEGTLKIHEKMHFVPRRHHCEKCGRDFMHKKSLRSHLQNHDLFRYHCSVCNQLFGTVQYLGRHMKLEHSVASTPRQSSSGKIVKENRTETAAYSEIQTGGDGGSIISEAQNEIVSVKKSSKQCNGNDLKKKKKFACNQCNGMFSKERFLISHKKLHSIGGKHFRCEKCGRKFRQKKSLTAHLLNHDLYTNRCTDCPQVFGKSAFLKQHMRMAHGAVPKDDPNANREKKDVSGAEMVSFTEIGNRDIGSGDSMKAEKKSLKQCNGTDLKKKKFACHLCNRTYTTAGALKAHEKLHVIPKPYCCEKCGRKFVKAESLRTHLRNHDAYTHYCSECNQLFGTVWRLKKHKILDHAAAPSNDHETNGEMEQANGTEMVIYSEKNIPKKEETETISALSKSKETEEGALKECNDPVLKEKEFVCKKCTKTFSREYNLKIHQKLHCFPEKFHCQKCGRKFKELKCLRAHVRNHDLYKYHCDICKQVFARAKYLVAHKQQDHGTRGIQNGNSSLKKAPEGISSVHAESTMNGSLLYRCKLCNVKYHTRKNFHLHMKWHSDDKIFRCDKCDKTFLHLGSLCKHLKNHDVYIHRCGICSQVFPRVSFLEKHVEMIHGVGSTTNYTSVETKQGDHKTKVESSSKTSGDHFTSELTKEKESDTVSYSKISGVISETVKETSSAENKSKMTETESSKLLNESVSRKKQVYNCKHCNKTLSSKPNLIYHEKIHSKFRCEKCGRTFHHLNLLEYHLKNHQNYTHYCDVCNQVFGRSSHLRKHKESKHGVVSTKHGVVSTGDDTSDGKMSRGNKTIVLPGSKIGGEDISKEPEETGFLQSKPKDTEKESLKEHSGTELIKMKRKAIFKQQKRTHVTKKFHLRSEVFRPTKKFQLRSKMFLSSTTESSRSGTFPCQKCGKIFRHAMSLKRHLTKHHCAVCDQVFATTVLMKKHKEDHHNENEVSDSQPQKLGENQECDATDILAEEVDVEEEEEEEEVEEEEEEKVRVTVPNALKVVKGAGPRFRCATCGTTFQRKDYLRNHHKTASKCQCSNCSQYFCHLRSLQKHQKKCKPDGISALNEESQDREDGFARNICEMPSDVTESVEAKDLPESTDDTNTISMDVIVRNDDALLNDNTTSKDSIATEKTTSKVSKNYKCEQCDKLFLSHRSLAAHRLLHSGKRPFSCAWCQTTFTRKDSLDVKHKKVAQKLQCDECGKHFCLRKNLKRHMNNDHNIQGRHPDVHALNGDKKGLDEEKHQSINEEDTTKSSPLVGAIKTESEASNSELQNFSTTETSFEDEQSTTTDDFANSTQRYIVMMIDESEKTNSAAHGSPGDAAEGLHLSLNMDNCTDLNSSMEDGIPNIAECKVIIPPDESSSETKPLTRWKCPQCDMLLTKPHSLINHLSIHSGAMPFQCSWCTRSFRRSDTMGKHKKTGKRLKCEVCGEQFCKERRFKRHLRSHQNEGGGENGDLSTNVGDDEVSEEEREENVSLDENIDNMENVEQKSEVAVGEEYKCLQCDRFFSSKKSLSGHNNNVHSGKRKKEDSVRTRTLLYWKHSKKTHLQKSEISKGCHQGESDADKSYESNGVFDFFSEDESIGSSESVQGSVIKRKKGRGATQDVNENNNNFTKRKAESPNEVITEPEPLFNQTDSRPYTCDQCPRTFILRHHLKRHVDAKHPTTSSTTIDVLNFDEDNCNHGNKNVHLSNVTASPPSKRKRKVNSSPQTHDVFNFDNDDEINNDENVRLKEDTAALTNTKKRKITSPGTGSSSKKDNSPPDGSKVHKCNVCDKILASKASLGKHMVVMHTGKREYKCDQCMKDFQFLSDLLTHLAVHQNDRPFECQICKYRFNRSEHLQTHFDKVHKETRNSSTESDDLPATSDEDTVLNKLGNRKIFSCGDCHKGFIYAMDLKKHKKVVHGGARMQLFKGASTHSYPGNCYTCDRCGKTFGLRTAFMNHRRKHIARDLGIALPRNCGVTVNRLRDSYVDNFVT